MRIARYSISILLLLVALPVLAVGCGSAKPSALTDEQVNDVVANILAAIDSADHTAFTRDFSDDMRAAFPKDQFDQLRDLLQGSSGNFVSTGDMTISNEQEFAIYRLICEYEEEDVVVTVVFRIDGKLVEGIYFDSPNLRTASQ